jgi:hypothetical protein
MADKESYSEAVSKLFEQMGIAKVMKNNEPMLAI